MNSRPSEFSIIKKYFAPFASKGAFDFRDDAAEIIPAEGCSLVITQDAIAEGVHFFSDDPPALIAKKALRVNLSDLAAKGARPRYMSLALGLGNSWNETWIAEFAKGLQEDAKKYNVELTGGDTFRTGGGFVISLTVMGELPQESYTSRLGAKPGDVLYVTGTIGDSALGLKARHSSFQSLNDDENNYLVDRYLLPQPRVEIFELIREYASAAMDISDGLVGDLEKFCSASDVSAHIEAVRIPLSKVVQILIVDESKYLQTALTGGDDYEILFTVSPDDCEALENKTKHLPFAVNRIGTITSGQGVKVFDSSEHVIEFEKTSYDHSGENS